MAEGPTINGTTSRIFLLSSEEVRQYEHLSDFVAWADVAFMKAHEHLFPGGQHRFDNTEAFLKEIAVPDGFTFIVTSQQPATNCNGEHNTRRAHDFYATISGRPFKGHRDGDPVGEEDDNRLYEEAQAKGIKQWEIKTVVVDPGLQGNGLGRLINDLVEAEFLKRFRASKLRNAEVSTKDASAEQPPNGHQEQEHSGLQIMLTTVREINAGFYKKCGYMEWHTKVIPKGAFQGINEEFSVSWMVKDLQVRDAGENYCG